MTLAEELRFRHGSRRTWITFAARAAARKRTWPNYCEMSTRAYQHVEDGSANVTLTMLARLVQGFEVDVEMLFRRRGRKRRHSPS